MLFLLLCDISVVIVFTSIVFAVKADVSPTMTGKLFTFFFVKVPFIYDKSLYK